MESSLVREKFLDFFSKKGHQIVSSAPLVLKNDPTLLFTNSGMVQFKDYFLGNAVPKSNRIADTQKCLRVSGKHNDLEEVGIDTYHHTMFEMLGNWSFGDYFKKEAIEWAWELLTEEYKLPKDRLYVSVFGGDEAEKLAIDEEAKTLWKKIIPEDRIIHGSKKDNFWEMGETGPCGPCSEIHIDLRDEDEVAKIPGMELVNNDHPQVIEIWNLVFMEFNRKADGSLEKLPAQHVDTGMGFERLCMAIQKKKSNYNTDVFSPLINRVEKLSGFTYGSNDRIDIAIRVIVDHIRAVAFAISDGQMPSNNGAGYVIRRILRRSIRYGYSYLEIRNPFMYELVGVLEEQFKDVFPEISSQRGFIEKVIKEEEESFLSTLEKGLKILDMWIDQTVKAARHFPDLIGDGKGEATGQISGFKVFELYDTFGFPIDLTRLILKEKGKENILIANWEQEFERALLEQKSRSKAAAVKETGDWILVGEDAVSEFIGYDHLEASVKIIKHRTIKQKNKELFQLVFDKTPFYAESGGQVGDTGFIQFGDEKISIVDTKKENDLTVHFADRLPKDLSATFSANVNAHKRKLTMSNHSATHLLHAALRDVLGKHVEQRGSLVNDKVLRFDFSHFAAMTDEEILNVEAIVNQKVRENIHLDEKRNVPIEQAKSLGAMALFGEKYGDFVRVITFDPAYSVELCGGTHVSDTGVIGLFKITSESSVAAGIRRIEAVTGENSELYVREEFNQLKEIRDLLKNPKDLLTSAASLIEDKHKLEKQIEALHLEQASVLKNELAQKVVTSNGYSLILEKISVPNADSLKRIAYDLKNQFSDLLLILAANVDQKPQVAVMIGDALMESKKFHAGEMVKVLAKEINGGGGGQPFFATAGGKNLEGLDAVISKAKELIK